MIRLAVLVSGSGTTLQTFIDAIGRGELEARIEVVVSNTPKAYALERARRAGIPAEAAPVGRIAAVLDRFRPELVVMAGFLKLWKFPPRYAGRVINIHPALLPKFGGRGMYGDRVHAAVLAAGESKSGCTVHVADHQYDHGPILLQREVPVLPGDTVASLRARVQEAERIAYPEAVRRLAQKNAT
jgi:formyltetrahydrofolate-dependent phosphoribosylglycinamide formyltransferase